MYLEHFGFTQFPFHLTPDTSLFLGLAPHYEALQTVNAALMMGEGVIKVVGEVGTGKTMVCRMLLSHLADAFICLYLPNPALTGLELRQNIARELRLGQPDEAVILGDIQAKLIELHQQGMKVVAIVDEAQALPDDALEMLRLMGNLETDQDKLLQLVLLGQPELDVRLSQHHLRQFRQRITFSATLRPLTLAETIAYIDNRLTKSGVNVELFSLSQKKAVWRAARGTPRLINQICHKTLLLCFNQELKSVVNSMLFSAIQDTFDACKPRFKTPCFWGWSHS